MSDPDSNSTVEEITKGIKTLDVDNQEVENLKEIILQGVKSIGTVTELITTVKSFMVQAQTELFT